MTEAHSAAYLAAVAAAEKAGVIKDGGVVARPRTLGRGEAFGTAALLGEGGVHGEALVAVDTVRCLVLDLRCDPNAACRQALRPLRIRIKGRSERSVSRQSRAVIPLSALRMVAPLGCGAWAHVQLAEHAASGEAFALKTISKREVLRRGTLDVVMKERRLVRMCAHPNVVELYTSYQDADNVHLLFEHLPGGELGALLRRTGPLDQAAARFYAACVLSALEAVHDAGVVRPPLPPPPTRGPAGPRPTGPRPTGPLLRSPAPPLVLLLPTAGPTVPAPGGGAGAPRRAAREPAARRGGLRQAARLRLRDRGGGRRARGDAVRLHRVPRARDRQRRGARRRRRLVRA